MAWCADVDACLRDLLPNLLLLQGACPDETDRALRLLNDVEPWLHGMCVNASLQRALDVDLASGATHALAACAAKHTAFADAYLPHLSVPTLRNFLCGPPPVFSPSYATPPPPASARLLLTPYVALAAAALAVACTALARRSRGFRGAAALFWVVVVGAALPRMCAADRTVDMGGFYLRDAVTECFHRLGALAPDAVLGDRLVTVSAPRAAAKAVYEELRYLRVDGTTLREMCGHCSLLASRELVQAFVLGDASTPPSHDDPRDALFSVVMPAFAPRAWRRAFAARWEERLRDRAEGCVVFASREQAEADVLRSMRAPPSVLCASAALTLATLWAAVACFQDATILSARAAGASLALSLLVMGVVVASLVVGEALCVLCGVPRSPFSLLVVPLCLGTGVDNALILLTSYRRFGRFDHAWPSIVASALTSTCSFAAGLLLAVPHLRSLFLTCIATVGSGTALHVLATPACIRLCVSKRMHAQQLTDGPPRQRLLWKPALYVLALLWLVLLPFVSPVVSTTDLTFQVAEASMTRRFMDRTRSAPETGSAALYALVTTDDANWTRLERHMARDLDARVTADWHRAYLASAAPTTSAAWKARSGSQLTFGAFFGRNGTSVLLGAVPKRATSDAAKADAMRAMHALDEKDVCFASEDYLSSYTMRVVQANLWKLALLTAIFSTLVGVGIAGRHGLSVFPALLMSYATMTGVVSATHMHMHMLLVAVYLIAPGFLVDFQLHMAFNPDTRSAVLLGAATSVASMTPYVFSHLPGVKEFSICYIGFLVIGLLHAFLATVTRSIDGWDAL